MKKIENECLNCKNLGLNCIGVTCPYISVERFYCDRCKEEAVLYLFDGEELCENCLLKNFPIVDGSDIYCV